MNELLERHRLAPLRWGKFIIRQTPARIEGHPEAVDAFAPEERLKPHLRRDGVNGIGMFDQPRGVARVRDDPDAFVRYDCREVEMPRLAVCDHVRVNFQNDGMLRVCGKGSLQHARKTLRISATMANGCITKGLIAHQNVEAWQRR